MKSIKIMLLGIACLLIASCGAPLWMAGSYAGAVMFIAGLILGLILCTKGFIGKE